MAADGWAVAESASQIRRHGNWAVAWGERNDSYCSVKIRIECVKRPFALEVGGLRRYYEDPTRDRIWDE